MMGEMKLERFLGFNYGRLFSRKGIRNLSLRDVAFKLCSVVSGSVGITQGGCWNSSEDGECLGRGRYPGHTGRENLREV
jgi:hypothetical protein